MRQSWRASGPKPTDDLSAYDAYTRGMAQFSRYTRAGLLEGRQLFERAVELDPGFAAAQAILGATYGAEYALGYSFDESLLERALEKAEVALRLDPGTPNAYTVQASVYFSTPNSADRSIAAADKAISLAPSFPVPHMFRGMALAKKGEFTEGLASIRKAFRLDPRVASNSATNSGVAGVYAALGRMDEAVELWEKARSDNPDLLTARLALIEYYMNNGDTEARPRGGRGSAKQEPPRQRRTRR